MFEDQEWLTFEREEMKSQQKGKMVYWKTFLLSAIYSRLMITMVSGFSYLRHPLFFLCKCAKAGYVIIVIDNSYSPSSYVPLTFWAASNSLYEMQLIRLKRKPFFL